MNMSVSLIMNPSEVVCVNVSMILIVGMSMNVSINLCVSLIYRNR